MSQGFVLLGDKTTHGGAVITASATQKVNGKPIALIGDLVCCPIPGHGVNAIIEGCAEHIEDGRQLVINGCRSVCGCVLISSITDHVVG
ncbi:PAAR domain-containing protein [Pseudomonas huanghezhanensis]|uniref:PAAR domain-containing protein n=1 Tax=Pseudomonas huanghezhanensis TaxID=3002903 RepID=UPI0022859482|nr:PAAR domain-containing protein [Pseudomonas sp. BSw22131]